MSPKTLFRAVAIGEACTWALLLAGMFLKYVTETTEALVSVGGGLHGFMFIAYCATTVLVGLDQKWSAGRIVLGLASAIPPFVTIPFDRSAERRGELGEAWRLRTEEPSGAVEKLVSWVVRKPLQGAAVAIGLVAVVFVTMLVVGPPF